MTMVLKEVHDIREKCPLTLFENHSKNYHLIKYYKNVIYKKNIPISRRENSTEIFLCDFQTSFARPQQPRKTGLLKIKLQKMDIVGISLRQQKCFKNPCPIKSLQEFSTRQRKRSELKYKKKVFCLVKDNSTFFSHCEVRRTIFGPFNAISFEKPRTKSRSSIQPKSCCLEFRSFFLRSMALKCSAEYGPIKR